jgi:uncharacterized cupredoxin-like copper-binding protein
MRRRLLVLLGASVALTGAALAGCGGGGDNSATTQAAAGGQTATSGGGNELTIKMGDYSFTPSTVSTKAGKVTISAPNDGQVEHELVLFKTDRSPGSLPTIDNEVDEEGLEAKGVESPGEIEEVGPGETKSNTFDLTPGKYLMICNIPGHFQRGMYGTVTVK